MTTVTFNSELNTGCSLIFTPQNGGPQVNVGPVELPFTFDPEQYGLNDYKGTYEFMCDGECVFTKVVPDPNRSNTTTTTEAPTTTTTTTTEVLTGEGTTTTTTTEATTTTTTEAPTTTTTTTDPCVQTAQMKFYVVDEISKGGDSLTIATSTYSEVSDFICREGAPSTINRDDVWTMEANAMAVPSVGQTLYFYDGVSTTTCPIDPQDILVYANTSSAVFALPSNWYWISIGANGVVETVVQFDCPTTTTTTELPTTTTTTPTLNFMSNSPIFKFNNNDIRAEFYNNGMTNPISQMFSLLLEQTNGVLNTTTLQNLMNAAYDDYNNGNYPVNPPLFINGVGNALGYYGSGIADPQIGEQLYDYNGNPINAAGATYVSTISSTLFGDMVQDFADKQLNGGVFRFIGWNNSGKVVDIIDIIPKVTFYHTWTLDNPTNMEFHDLQNVYNETFTETHEHYPNGAYMGIFTEIYPEGDDQNGDPFVFTGNPGELTFELDGTVINDGDSLYSSSVTNFNVEFTNHGTYILSLSYNGLVSGTPIQEGDTHELIIYGPN